MKLQRPDPKFEGAATIPTVLALTILVTAIAISITAVSLIESFVAAGQNQATLALVYAEAGARDALLKIARNKNYTCATTDCYQINMVSSGCTANEGCAKVTVSAGLGTGADPKIITSKGLVLSKTRRVQVNVTLDSSLNGEIASTTWQELTN